MSYSYYREKRFLYGAHGGYFTGAGAGATGLRSQRDVLGSSYGNIETRLFSEESDPTTEEEWRRLLDAGMLIEKAVELVRQRIRYPKSTFEYSPESPSPKPYDAPSGTVLLPNPRSPRDKEGKRIRDMGSEIKDHDTTDIASTNGYRASSAKRMKKADTEKAKSLRSLKDIDENDDTEVLVEKPNIRERLASQRSKDEQKSDAESKSSSRSEATKLSSQSETTKSSRLSDSTTSSRRSETTKSSSQSEATKSGSQSEATKSSSQSEATSTQYEPTRSRARMTRDEIRNTTRSMIDTVRSTPSVTDTGRSTPSVTDTGRSTPSVTDKPTTSVSESHKSITSVDDTRDSTKPTNDSLLSTRNNLSQSTQSLYSSTDRYKTRAEIRREALATDTDKTTSTDRRSERFRDYSTSNTGRPRSSMFRSEHVFGERKVSNEKESTTVTQDDSDDKTTDRRPSFLKTLKNAASRNKKRPPSAYEERMLKREQEKESPKKSHLSAEVDEPSNIRRASDHLIYTNAELIRMAQEDLVAKKGKRVEETSTPTLKKKTPSSSSFHEYHPDKRVPLKDRLKNKMSETSTSTDDDDRVAISSSTPLAQRASRLAREKSTEKVEDSLKSRFLRRFRLGSEEKGEEKKETNERRSRKKTDSSQDDDSTSREKDGDKKDEETKNEAKASKYEVKEQIDPSKYDSYTTRGMKMSMDHRMTSIDIDMETQHKTGTSLNEILAKEEEIVGVDMSKYNPYSYSSRLKKSKDGKSGKSSQYDRQESTDPVPLPKSSRSNSMKDEKVGKGSAVSRKTKSIDIDDNKTHRKSRAGGKEETKTTTTTDDNVVTIRDRDKDKATLKEPKSEFQRDDIPSPKGTLRLTHRAYSFDQKKEDGPKTSESESESKLNKSEGTSKKKNVQKVEMLRRKSLHISEEQINPVIKTEEIQLDFKSPRASLTDEIEEQIISSSVADAPMRGDFFKVLLQREVSEEEVNIIGTREEQPDVLLNNLFERLNQFPPGSKRTSSTTSSELNSQYRESLSSDLSSSEHMRSGTASTDELIEHNDVFVNTDRSSSSGDLFEKIEKANNRLYLGLLGLTNTPKVSGDETDHTMQDSDGSSSNEKKDGVSKNNVSSNSIVQNTADNIEANVDLSTGTWNVDTSERMPHDGDHPVESLTEDDIDPNNKVSVSREIKNVQCEEVITEHIESKEVTPTKLREEQFEPSPFKLTRTKKVDYVEEDNTAEPTPAIADNDDKTRNPGKDGEYESKNDKDTSLVAKEGDKVSVKTKADKSFDKTVDETTEDVNKMLSNCNSIDKINDEIQRSHSTTASDEHRTGGDEHSTNMSDRSQSASPNRKKMSYLEKRASHMKFFQNEMSVSNEDIQDLGNSRGSSKESLDTNGAADEKVNESDVSEVRKCTSSTDTNEVAGGKHMEDAAKREESDLLGGREQVALNETREGNSSVESSVLDEIINNVEENITLDELSTETQDNNKEMSLVQNEQEEDVTNKETKKLNLLETKDNENKMNENKESQNLDNTLNIDISKDDVTSLKAEDEVNVPGELEDTVNRNVVESKSELSVETDGDQKVDEKNIEGETTRANEVSKAVTHAKPAARFTSKSLETHDDIFADTRLRSNRAKMAAMRSTQSVEIKSLEEIRSRLDEIKSSSVTSSVVNVNVIMDSKPPVELKSLDEIKSRLSEIKARKKQLQLVELNKQTEKDAAITSQVTDVSISSVRKVKLNDLAESADEQVTIEDNDKDEFVMSPIRKIKLSNDFLEEDELNEEQCIENEDAVLENGVFDDHPCEVLEDGNININGHNQNANVNLNQDKVVCNGNISTEIHVNHSETACQNHESDVKASMDELINEIVDNNNNNNNNEAEQRKTGINTEGIENGRAKYIINVQNDENYIGKPAVNKLEENKLYGIPNGVHVKPIRSSNDEGTNLLPSKETKEECTPVPNKREGDNQNVCLNGHGKYDAKQELNGSTNTSDKAASHLLVVDDISSSTSSTEANTATKTTDTISSSTSSTETNTTSKTTDTQGLTNGNHKLPKIPKFVFPRQMSIVEYRRQKLEKSPSELLSPSDEEIPCTKSEDREHKSSVADISDTSDDCRERKKFYRYSKKDIKNSAERLASSASEDDEDISLVDRLANRYTQRTRTVPAINKSPTSEPMELSNISTNPLRKTLSQKYIERFKENGNV